MFRGRKSYRPEQRGALNALANSCTRFGLWLAVLALFSQALAFAVPPMAPLADSGDAVRELRALLGPGVVICTQSDDSGTPAAPANCNDRCPLCQASAGAFAFVAPATAPYLAPRLTLLDALAFPATPRAPPRGPLLTAFARGPPSLI